MRPCKDRVASDTSAYTRYHKKGEVMARGQKEFTGMLPERSPLGKKAIEYIHITDAIDKLEADKDKLKKELIELFLASGKTSIRVEGITVSYSHAEMDKIAVRQEKQV